MTLMQTNAHNATRALRLGLIGGNIRQSRAPALHRLSGRLTGIEVTYDLLIPAEIGLDFPDVFERCRTTGLRGVNVTYPFKEAVVPLITISDPEVARIGSVNTVVFGSKGPQGYNTDYTGFVAAYRARFADRAPGRVALVGTGGVGRAIAFALLALGARELRLVDRDVSKAKSLGRVLASFAPGDVDITTTDDVEAAVPGADGIINATPLGMAGNPGSAVPARLLDGCHWAFDAVYTPVETEFVRAAGAAGVNILSGYELFFYQGVHAFELFAGTVPDDLAELRRLLDENPSA